MSASVVGAVVGAVVGLGTSTAVSGLPLVRRPTLDARIAPYLGERAREVRPSRGRQAVPTWTLERVVGPRVRTFADRLDAVLGGSASVRHRLEQSGRATTVEQFRVEQLTWAAAGFVIGLLAAAAAAAHGPGRGPLAFLVVAVGLAAAGALARDQLLSVEVARRRQRLLAELPTLAELFALSVGAGEGVSAAIERVTTVSRGELVVELRRALADAHTGTPLTVALEGMADRIAVPALVRFVDGIAIAIERGTPLADVLRAQAFDAREMGRRALLDAAGRKEIAMLVPVVFLVLPVTIVFALFPGFYNLSLAVP